MDSDALSYREGFDIPPDTVSFRFLYGHNGENVYGVTFMWLEKEKEHDGYIVTESKTYTIAIRNMEGPAFAVHIINNDFSRTGLTVIHPNISAITDSIGPFPGDINIEPIIDEAVKRMIKINVVSILARCDINWASYIFDEWLSVEEDEREERHRNNNARLHYLRETQKKRDLEETKTSFGRTLH